MTDTDRDADAAALLAGLPAGISGSARGQGALILRHRDAAELARLAMEIVPVAKRAGVRVLVSGDARLALESGADGVHLPEALLRRKPHLGRMRLRPDWIVTASAHGAPALRAAARAGVDAVLLSTVLASESHPELKALGALRLAGLCRRAKTAVVALGGIGRGNLLRLKHAGLRGVAGIGVFSVR